MSSDFSFILVPRNDFVLAGRADRPALKKSALVAHLSLDGTRGCRIIVVYLNKIAIESYNHYYVFVTSQDYID